jgi:hypothetical protein
VSAVAASFAVRRTEVYRWLEQLRDDGKLGHRPRGRPRRGSALPAPGSAAREAELERLVGQQRLELDFFSASLAAHRAGRRPWRLALFRLIDA